MTKIEIKNNFYKFLKQNLKIFLPAFLFGIVIFYLVISYYFDFSLINNNGNNIYTIILPYLSDVDDRHDLLKCFLIFIIYYSVLFFITYLLTYLFNIYKNKRLFCSEENYFFIKKMAILFAIIATSIFWLAWIIEMLAESSVLQADNLGLIAFLMGSPGFFPLLAFSTANIFLNIAIAYISTKISEHFGRKFFKISIKNGG